MNSLTYKEIVKLPSKGLLYPKDHPFHNKEEIEIRHLTAKDEDLLTTKSLIRSGELSNILVKEVVIDKNLDIDTLLNGDKNAILIFTRIFSFGGDYNSMATCKFCNSTDEYQFDISKVPVTYLEAEPINKFENLFYYKTTKGTEIEFRLATVGITKEIEKDLETQEKFKKKNFKYSEIEKNATTPMLHIIHSINGSSDKKAIVDFLNTASIQESRELKKYIKNITPNVEFKDTIYCTNCGKESEVMLEFNPSFFWADF